MSGQFLLYYKKSKRTWFRNRNSFFTSNLEIIVFLMIFFLVSKSYKIFIYLFYCFSFWTTTSNSQNLTSGFFLKDHSWHIPCQGLTPDYSHVCQVSVTASHHAHLDNANTLLTVYFQKSHYIKDLYYNRVNKIISLVPC